MSGFQAQTLLLDADDTLWENHAYFLEVCATFLDLMEARGHERARATLELRTIEHERTRKFGYGSLNYALSLIATVERIEGAIEDELRERFLELGRWIHNHPIELLPGVLATLDHLGPRHRLFLVTKGNRIEQLAKIARSGLVSRFSAVEVLEEKDVARYAELLGRHALDGASSWMVGNSPRSDINPAKAAGLKTVFIPHRTIWEFEHEDLDGGADLHLTAFAELCSHF